MVIRFITGIFKTRLLKPGIMFLFSLIHLGTDFRIWNDVVEILKEYGHILLFDKRGHGLSDTVENTNGLA